MLSMEDLDIFIRLISNYFMFGGAITNGILL